MNARDHLPYWLASLLLTLLSASALQADARKPNIVVIVGDDMGYGDISCQGCKDIPTPNIDSLAKNGVRCTSGYVSGPYCSPTRAGLMTGRYQQRFGHEFNPGPPNEANVEVGLSLNETTLPSRLKSAGYATGMVGKWHLGHAEKFHPLSRGFQSYFGFLGGAHAYFPEQANRGPNAVLRGREPANEKEYLTDAFSREAVAFVDQHQKEPFFLYLAFNAVHTPMHAAEKYLKRFDKIEDKGRRNYAAMMSAMDDAVGNVLQKVRASGLEEQTLIFFISDNGGPPVNSSNNGPLNGHKATTWEGGIRVPYLAQWKGKLPAGKVYDQPVIQLDIHATALAAAGVTLPADAKPLDGVNLLPHLTGQASSPPHDALYWRFGEQIAIRRGDWKAVRARGTEVMLFNLADDLGEKNDLAAKQPEKLAELQTVWKKWDSELVKPTWGGAGPGKKARAKARAKTT